MDNQRNQQGLYNTHTHTHTHTQNNIYRVSTQALQSNSNMLEQFQASTQDDERDLHDEEKFIPTEALLKPDAGVHLWVGAWDSAGVYVYQAFNDEIADYALEHQKLEGCPAWRPNRGTWIKPSLAWMLYRSGYGKKCNQNRVLRIHLSHETLSYLLQHCKLVDTNKETRKGKQELTHEGGGNGRVQWDPERDLFSVEKGGRSPRRMLRQRAIQICLSGSLSQFYASNIISIEDVTELAYSIGDAHKLKKSKEFARAMQDLQDELPEERPYLPRLLPDRKLQELGMLPGAAANVLNRLGRGKVNPSRKMP